MKYENLSFRSLRRIMLNTQLLDRQTPVADGKDGVLEVMDRLGYVQIDTLTVVRRAHHHVLWSRFRDYSESLLDDLLASDRKVFEYWGHAVCYLLMDDYRFFLPRMQHFSDPKTKWGEVRLQKFGHLMKPVLETIRENGPMTSSDFAKLKGKKNRVGEKEPPQAIRVALDLLFWKGDVMVSQRNSFRKVFDLTERVLPKDVDRSFPSNEELGRYFVRRALSALGVASDREINAFMQPEGMRDSDIRATTNGVIDEELQKMMASGEVVPVRVKEDSKTLYYAFGETLKRCKDLEPLDAQDSQDAQVHFLSPFDNLIIRRERMKRLFDFQYTLECYVPPKKRKFGYFVLPVLWGDRLVARFDPKTDKKNKTLTIHNLVYETGFDEIKEFRPAFEAALEEFARFNGCSSFTFAKS